MGVWGWHWNCAEPNRLSVFNWGLPKQLGIWTQMGWKTKRNSFVRQECVRSVFNQYLIRILTKKAQIKENHRLCLKRLRPNSWLDMDEVRQCFTTAVRRRLLVGINEMNSCLVLTANPKVLWSYRDGQCNSFRVFKAHTGKADIMNSSLADSQFKSESTKYAKHSSTAKSTRSHSSRQHPVTRSSTPNQRYSSKCDPFCRLFNLTFFFCCLGHLHSSTSVLWE